MSRRQEQTGGLTALEALDRMDAAERGWAAAGTPLGARIVGAGLIVPSAEGPEAWERMAAVQQAYACGNVGDPP